MHLIFDSSRKNISDHDFQHITPNLAITRSLKLPIATRRFKIPTAALERPANKLDIKFHTCLDLFGVSLELIYIPIRPQKFALQEARFRACKPNMEARRKRNYITVSLVTYCSVEEFLYLPLSSMPSAATPPASLFISVSTTPGWTWKTLSPGFAKATVSHSRYTANLATL